MKKFLMVLTLLSWFGLRAGHALEVGEPMPDITATNQKAEPVRLKELAASGYTLVYFYPKADTSGCTAQACSLRDAYEDLKAKGVRVFGVSTDTAASQLLFQEKYKLPFELLADPEGKLVDAFGVSRLKGYAARQAYLFKDGKLIWRDLKASTAKQAEDVLEVINRDGKAKSPE
jgi:peroxiredoxin Q/BCP